MGAQRCKLGGTSGVFLPWEGILLLCHPLVNVAARGIPGAHFTQQSLPSNPPAPECDSC